MTIYYDSDYCEISEESLYELYDDMLDDTSEEIELFGSTYSPSYALRELDPIAYRCGFHDYTDALMQDGELYEGEHEFIDLLLVDWMRDHIADYDDILDSFEFENELLWSAGELYSGGWLELVDGELQPHTHHTVEQLVSMIVDTL